MPPFVIAKRAKQVNKTGAVRDHSHAADNATEQGEVERGDNDVEPGKARTLGVARALHAALRDAHKNVKENFLVKVKVH